LRRIRRFVEEYGHSEIPDEYSDELSDALWQQKGEAQVNGFQIAGVLWLAAAVSSAWATMIFRDDAWYAITLVASAVAALVGILLLWRPNGARLLLSTVVGVAWVVMYGVLIVIQWDDFGAWSGNAFFGLVGAAGAYIAYRTGATKPDSTALEGA
jgi:hypothetical protein